VHHSLFLYSTLLVHHSLSLYILICLLYKGTLLYCITYFNIQRLSIILTWYQSHCSKCFVQSSSFLAFFRCLNHLRYCSAAAVRILVCPLPSKVEQSPKTHCLRWNFLSRIPIETPPPPLESSLEDDLSRAKIAAIRRRTRRHAPIKESACRHAFSRAPTRLAAVPATCQSPSTPRQP
jgi:hypothetical protein